MLSASPIAMVTGIVLCFLVFVLLLLVFQDYRTFRGYREIADDAKRIAKDLAGELFRDGDDLVVSGDYQSIPVLLRFSNSEHTPAMSLEARIPSSLDLCIAPRQFADNKAGLKVALPGTLEHRFAGKCKDPVEAKMLLEQRRATDSLTRLCCSQRTMLEITPGRLQLLELVVPSSPARHISEHLKDIGDLSKSIAELPGSDAVKIVPIPREHSSWTFKASMAVGLVVAAVSVMAATRDRAKPKVVKTGVSPSVGRIAPADAPYIPLADQWRSAPSEDFDAIFAAWANSTGQPPSSHFNFDPDGTGHSKGVAYWLVNKDGARRIVLLVDHRVVFDSSFPKISGIAHLPAAAVAKIQREWEKNVDSRTSGDGILLVRSADDPHSAIIFYFENGKLESASPSDYRNVSLE